MMPGSQNGEHISGHCRICDQRFFWMTEQEYKHAAARHIVENHRDQPIDKPLVVPMTDNTLSEFGEQRVRELAVEHAVEVDSRNTIWRYRAEQFLGLFRFAFSLQFILSVLTVPVSLLLGWQTIQFVKSMLLALVILVIATVVHVQIENPEVNFGD